MIAIVNVSAHDSTSCAGINTYEVRINQRVIATFNHERKQNGAAQCLRDAADAIDRCRAEEKAVLIDALLKNYDNF